MDKLSKIYYSPKGYWKGLSAIDKLAKEAGVSKEKAKEWLKQQTVKRKYFSRFCRAHAFSDAM